MQSLAQMYLYELVAVVFSGFLAKTRHESSLLLTKSLNEKAHEIKSKTKKVCLFNNINNKLHRLNKIVD